MLLQDATSAEPLAFKQTANQIPTCTRGMSNSNPKVYFLRKTCPKPNPKFNLNAMIEKELRFCSVALKMERQLRPHN